MLKELHKCPVHHNCKMYSFELQIVFFKIHTYIMCNGAMEWRRVLRAGEAARVHSCGVR